MVLIVFCLGVSCWMLTFVFCLGFDVARMEYWNIGKVKRWNRKSGFYCVCTREKEVLSCEVFKRITLYEISKF